MKNIMDLFKIAKSYYDYLEGKIEIDEFGRPIFKKEHFLTEEPEKIYPITFLRSGKILHKKNYLLCFFSGDKLIYPRFEKIFQEIDYYKTFLGVVEPDITFTRDMDIELQNAIMTLNQLFLAILAVNGIKIVGNTRTGSISTNENLSAFPKNVTWCSGFLGCDKASNFREAGLYVNKILYLLPRKLFIYGKADKLIFKQLDNLGIDYKRFDDFHKISKQKKRGVNYGRLQTIVFGYFKVLH